MDPKKSSHVNLEKFLCKMGKNFVLWGLEPRLAKEYKLKTNSLRVAGVLLVKGVPFKKNHYFFAFFCEKTKLLFCSGSSCKYQKWIELDL